MEFMKQKTLKYTEGEIGSIKVVKDFIPPLDQLVVHEENVKVTRSLSRRSIEFFNREAGKRRVPYSE
jgi:hypothetical protein